MYMYTCIIVRYTIHACTITCKYNIMNKVISRKSTNFMYMYKCFVISYIRVLFIFTKIELNTAIW